MEIKYSQLSNRTRGSEIRELLKYTRIKDIISFAGGLPDPSLFPIQDVTRITKEVLEEKGFLALQYGPTIGEPDFIEAIKDHMNQFGEDVELDQICVSSSSQQGLDLVSLVMLNEGDEIIVELPSYLGGLQAFERTGCVMNGIPVQDDGMDVGPDGPVVKFRLREHLVQEGHRAFFFNVAATTEIYTLSLHDALPIDPYHHTDVL